jgi:histidine triad (HIT) family protein
MDIHPRAPGHSFVIPKRHAETILELSDAELGAVFGAVRNLVAKIKNAMNPDGFTIGANHGKAGGQAIDHLHVHIIPRWRNDGGGSIHSVVRNPPRESIAGIAQQLRENSFDSASQKKLH